MKANYILRSFLPALAIVGLLSGGFVANGEDSPANNEKATLADFLPGKRVIIPPPIPEGQEPPPGFNNMHMLVQFEKNGNFTGGVVAKGKAMKMDGNANRPMTYKVDKQTVTILKNGKAVGTIIFSTATPKKGDQVTLPKKDGEQKITLKIISVTKAGPLKAMPPGGPFGPAPDLEEAPRKEPDIER